MQREIPPAVMWGAVAVVVLLAAVLLYRAWMGGVHTYGESVPKPAPGMPGAPSGTVPGAPGGTIPGAPGGTPSGTPPAAPPSGY
jgi:hypothetical protein